MSAMDSIWYQVRKGRSSLMQTLCISFQRESQNENIRQKICFEKSTILVLHSVQVSVCFVCGYVCLCVCVWEANCILTTREKKLQFILYGGFIIYYNNDLIKYQPMYNNVFMIFLYISQITLSYSIAHIEMQCFSLPWISLSGCLK